MGKVRLKISPTQVDTFILCERKWGWRILDGEREPQKASALYGEKVHTVAEGYQLTGRVDATTPHGRTFVPGIPFLPLPGTAHVETKFTFSTEIATYSGRIDLHFIDVDGVPTILDHKTTSDFRWMKTAEQLRGKDPQSIIYGVWGLTNYRSEIIRLRWVYYLTGQRPAARKVETVVNATELEEPFEKIELTSQKMLGYYESGARALDLPPNPNACGAYGGCAFAAKCNLTTAEVMRGIIMQNMLASKLQAARTQPQQQQLPAPHEQAVQQAVAQMPRIAPINPPVQPTAPVAAPAAAVGGALAGRLAAARGAAPQAQPQVQQQFQPAPQQMQLPQQQQVQLPPQPQFTQPAPVATPPVATQAAPQAPVAAASPSVAATGPAPFATPETTLRDMLASSIVNGILAARLFDLSAPQTPERVAFTAYELADAMLQVRGA